MPTLTQSSLSQIPQGLRKAPLWPILITVGLGVLGTLLALRGLDFYRLPIHVRPDHDDYRVLSPTGMVGQGYGFVGTALIFLNLLYLVRKKFERLGRGNKLLRDGKNVYAGGS